MKRTLMSARDKILSNWSRYSPRIHEVSDRVATIGGHTYSACKKYAPNLRQVSGLVMIVNTFLPAIVVLTLGLMIWSTASAIRRDACVTASYIEQALADNKGLKGYLAAPDEPLTPVELLILDLFVAGESTDSIMQTLDVTRTAVQKVASSKWGVLASYIKELKEQPPINSGPCEAWKDARTRIKQVVVDKLYGNIVTDITKDIQAVGKDFDKMKTAVAKAIPRVGWIKYSGIPGVDQAIWAANQVVKVIRDALGVVGSGLKAVGSYLASPLVKGKEDLTEEFQKIDYKRAVTWGLLSSFFWDTATLFGKFKWFFIGVALWLVLSYVLWVYRRLTVGWALLWNRDAT